MLCKPDSAAETEKIKSDLFMFSTPVRFPHICKSTHRFKAFYLFRFESVYIYICEMALIVTLHIEKNG